MQGGLVKGGFIAALVGVLFALLASGVGAEPPTKAEVGSGSGFSLGVDVKPKRLPKTEPAPAGLVITAAIEKTDGSHPSALESLVVDVDRNISIDLTGVPACRPGVRLDALPSSFDPREDCKEAIVGHGRVTTEISFPDACCAPPIESGLLIVNGGTREGIPTLFAYAEINVPVPDTIVTTIKIRRTREGRYGTRATFSIPKIAGGSGSLTTLRARIFKRFSHAGKSRSLITARCADGKLAFRADAAFADGTRAHSDAVRACAQPT